MPVKPYTEEELDAKIRRISSKQTFGDQVKNLRLRHGLLKLNHGDLSRDLSLLASGIVVPPARVDIDDIPIEVVVARRPKRKKKKQAVSPKKRYSWAPSIPQGEWDALRSAVLVRDDIMCVECGAGGEAHLTCHHIDHDKTNNDPDNLITLCWPCHMPKQSEYWKRMNNAS